MSNKTTPQVYQQADTFLEQNRSIMIYRRDENGESVLESVIISHTPVVINADGSYKSVKPRKKRTPKSIQNNTTAIGNNYQNNTTQTVEKVHWTVSGRKT